jgi:hypothetical protein
MRNTLKLDTSGFEEMLKKLDSVGGNAQSAVNKMLTKAANTIRQDTYAAIDAANLPRQGKYSKGDTEKSIVTDTSVNWEGLTAWIPVGFDFSKAGAGGYLITGTPRMKPDAALNKMYKQKKYMAQIQQDMSGVVLDAIVRTMTK